ncbi:hypothetical protein N7456_010916 [Penicillium angulare]|uniref:Uncharacterized protein n=1 Tax=Penicillium angulare TaxID=116970 RepID=A0A9W9JZK2_9EURO|nr:hypothetical protein N7456_010916 [Penicillium angulare]
MPRRKKTASESIPSTFQQVLATLDIPPPPKYSYDLTRLDDPPDDFVFLDKSWKDCNGRGHTSRGLQIIVLLQLWGIYWTDKKQPNKVDTAKAIWKYFYHVPKKFWPKFPADLFSVERDSGPRLINWEHHDEDIGPISRFHPVRPDPYRQPAQGFVRPEETGWLVSDVDMERYLLPLTKPVATKPGRKSVHHIEGPKIPEPKQMPPIPELIQTQKKTKMIGLKSPVRDVTPRGVDPVIEAPQFFFNYQPLAESLERAILHFTYRHLERSPDAPSKVHKAPQRAAESAEDLKNVQFMAYPAYSHLRLNPYNLEFDRTANCLYPYRGRGPIWSAQSCAIDCCIVLGQLLEVGCTRIDRESWRFSEITDLEKAFIQVTNTNWDALSPDQNIQTRDVFRRIISDTVPSIKMTESCPVWAIWAESTRNFAQFYFRFTDVFQSCPCSNDEIKEINKYANCILPGMQDSDRDGVWLNELIERTIYQKRLKDCPGCGARLDKWETRIEELPPRMTVSNFAGLRARVINHTDDVRFRYIDTEGKDRVATYRWLGGVYHQDNHVRVYWSEQERGDKERFEVCMYDDQLSGGAIFGGVQPAHKRERVPADWTTIGPLIGVYERVINPSELMLENVSMTVSNLQSLVRDGYAVLDRHSPWEHPHEPNSDDPSTRFVASLINEDRLIVDHMITEVDHPDPMDSEQDMLRGKTFDELANVWPPVDGDTDMPEEYQNLFDGLLDSPGKLSHLPELWPNGVPGDHGALNFPMLPRSESARSRENSRNNTPMQSLQHMPTPNKPLKLDLGWGRPFGWGTLPYDGHDTLPFGEARPAGVARPRHRSIDNYEQSPGRRYHPYSPRRTSVVSRSSDKHRVTKVQTSPGVQERRAESREPHGNGAQKIIKKEDKEESEAKRKRALPRKEKEEVNRQKKSKDKSRPVVPQDMDIVMEVEENIKEKNKKRRSELKSHVADEHDKRQKKKTTDAKVSKRKMKKAGAQTGPTRTGERRPSWRERSKSVASPLSSSKYFASVSDSRITPDATSHRGQRAESISPREMTRPYPKPQTTSNKKSTRGISVDGDSEDERKQSNDKHDKDHASRKSSGEKKSKKEKEKTKEKDETNLKEKKTTTNSNPSRVSKSKQKTKTAKGIYSINYINTFAKLIIKAS